MQKWELNWEPLITILPCLKEKILHGFIKNVTQQ